ncbi:MAG TPA: DNA recombination protein RmuC [Thermoanaerobaculia bacterium]|nr:DNA recombination protein RmuC [Thermoanaerobaculia bacterium]
MDPTLIVPLGLVGGFLLGWLIASSRHSSMRHRLSAERDLAIQERQRAETSLQSLRERMETEQRSRVEAETSAAASQAQLEQMSRFVAETRQQLEGAYAKLSQDALGSAIQQLLEVVKPHLDGARGEIVSTLDTKKTEIDLLLSPVREMLDKYRTELKESEEKRSSGYSTLQDRIGQLLEATEAARKETSRLATALANPKVSGTWGEQALQRCVELAGMTQYCHFETQQTYDTRESGRVRPDMTILLPNDRKIAVDAKAPMTAYLEASAETDEKRQKEFLAQHARNLRRHIDQLGSREYHDSIGESLDLTILFLGGEQFLYAAMVADPAIFEYGAERKVFIATPTVLVPLLRVVSIAWRADQTEEHAKRALESGSELYERFLKVLRDIEAVGRALTHATQRYDEAVRSINARLVPKARELQSFVGSSREVPRLEPVDAAVSRVTNLAIVDEDEEEVAATEMER